MGYGYTSSVNNAPSASGWCYVANKRQYASHDDVMKACTEFTEPYLCRFCYVWHQGHTKKGRRAERRAILKQMVADAETGGLYDVPEVPPA